MLRFRYNLNEIEGSPDLGKVLTPEGFTDLTKRVEELTDWNKNFDFQFKWKSFSEGNLELSLVQSESKDIDVKSRRWRTINGVVYNS